MPSQTRSAASAKRKGRAISAAAIVVCCAAMALWIVAGRRQSAVPERRPAPLGTVAPEQLLQQARDAFRRQDYPAAERIAARISEDAPESAAALVLAGDSAARQKQFEQALRYYARVVADDSAESIAAALSRGLVHKELGHAAEAEMALRTVLKHDPRNLPAHNGLAHLLGVSGRSWEAVPHFLEPVRQSQFGLQHLLLLGSMAPIVQDPELLSRCQQARPDNPVPLTGRARQIMFESSQFDEARRILERIVRSDPGQAEAQARLGRILIQRGTPQEILVWHQQLEKAGHDDPQVQAEIDQHPEIWVVRAEWAQQAGQPEAALRCCWEAVKRDPDHQVANYQLGLGLNRLQRSDEAQPFLARGQLLSELSNTAGLITTGLIGADRPQPEHVETMARTAEKLGRIWEAWGWCQVARQSTPLPAWASELEARVTPLLNPDLPRTLVTASPAMSVDLSTWPLPQWSAPEVPATPEFRPDTDSAVIPSAEQAIHFRDVAQEAGLSFVYFPGAELTAATGRMYETTGGGVAVLDLDCDDWPDLYFTQGSDWPPGSGSVHRLDRIFRNSGGTHLLDVTESAGISESGFSQGVTVGDFNNDGFQDLYVANIGGNRCFRNNGDATFSDVTDVTGTAGDRWTTSCLMADLNGDRLPDLYQVNYLSGDDVFSRVCTHSSGVSAGCGPEHFPAAGDLVFRNLGDDRFVDCTSGFDPAALRRKGLGIVAADFSGSGALDLYVANDAEPNSFFVNQSAASAGEIRFTEQALAAGIAFDGQGRPQAGMGIAADDASGDGRMDLFVTNYYLESNTLYQQQTAMTFTDVSHMARLSEPSHFLLGFGTQFLDADLDGWRDLVVANGHVHNLSRAGIPWQMEPQLFRNQGNGQFELAATAGDYFRGRFLGRGLARLDWNRDGREDFAVSHIGAPAALVTNASASSGHSVSLVCHGTESSRDAIGTIVRVTAGGRTWERQLTAGDGYQASNQRSLVFGLGDTAMIDTLNVRWPAGIRQTFHNIPSGAEILLVEGRAALFLSADSVAP